MALHHGLKPLIPRRSLKHRAIEKPVTPWSNAIFGSSKKFEAKTCSKGSFLGARLLERINEEIDFSIDIFDYTINLGS